jgi:hypothetical protein|tara:strand:- start:20 stop:193 length:174 start_codon:yes stop_codon:yes gene_type:complete
LLTLCASTFNFQLWADCAEASSAGCSLKRFNCILAKIDFLDMTAAAADQELRFIVFM